MDLQVLQETNPVKVVHLDLMRRNRSRRSGIVVDQPGQVIFENGPKGRIIEGGCRRSNFSMEACMSVLVEMILITYYQVNAPDE
jgi:hypothetical protein